MTALYSEIEPYPAQWLRNLVAAGQIAPGAVIEGDMRAGVPGLGAATRAMRLGRTGG